jgi:hypothetical protein
VSITPAPSRHPSKILVFLPTMAKDKKNAAARPTSGDNIFTRFEKWFRNNEKKVLISSIMACVFLTFISFNARISEAHDDALYLEGGWRYVHEFPTYFYTQNAPLYPMFLGLLISIIGFKLIIFKVVSAIFNLLGLYLFFKALKGRVPAVIFLPVLIFQATNYLIIYYASMTFTEAFYFFLQGLFFFYATTIRAMPVATAMVLVTLINTTDFIAS